MRASTRQAAASRYRRSSLPLSHRRGEGADGFDAVVAQVRREGVRGEIVAATPADTAPSARRIGRLGIRVASAISAILATTLGVGVFASTAYFTDESKISATVAVGTADLGMRSVNGASLDAEPLTLSGLVPLSTSAAADNTRGGVVSFKVKPATLDARAVVTAQGLSAGSATDLMGYVRVNFSVDGGSTWSAPQPLTTASVLRSDEFTVAKQPAASSTLSGVLKVRFYLTSDTPDSFQGKSLAFSIGVRSIQSSAPAGTSF